MKYITLLLSLTMMSGCYSSSSNTSSSGNHPFSTPQYAYAFSQSSNSMNVHSIKNEALGLELVASGISSIEPVLTVREDNSSIIGGMFLFKSGTWLFISNSNNEAKTIAQGTQFKEVCNKSAQQAGNVAYLYFSTPGADEECSKTDDNAYYRIDSSMNEKSMPIQVENGAIFDKGYTPVIIKNTFHGFLVLTEDATNTLIFVEPDLTTTVPIKTDVLKVRDVFSSINRESSIFQIGEDLYDLTLSDLKSGDIGEPVWSGTQLIYSHTPNQLYFSDRIKGNSTAYKYNLDNKTVHSIYSENMDISDVKVSNNSVMVSISGDYKHISTNNIDNIQSKDLSLPTRDISSSTLSNIKDGFLYSTKDKNGFYTAHYIDEKGEITVINNARWITPNNMNVNPTLLQYGVHENTLSSWSTKTKSPEILFGKIPKEIVRFRLDDSLDNTFILSSYSKNDSLDGIIYSFVKGQQGSLHKVSPDAGFGIL